MFIFSIFKDMFFAVGSAITGIANLLVQFISFVINSTCEYFFPTEK